MITTSKWLAVVAVAFLAGSFLASPELRAFAANTVRSIDIVDGQVKTADLGNNAVTAGKIKDGEIKAAEIATDAVGAAELQGVTKLLYGVCKTTEFEGSAWAIGTANIATCAVNGASPGDNVMAFLSGKQNNICYTASNAWVDSANTVKVYVQGNCVSGAVPFNTASTLSVMVYHK
jgi:hypothetical protein